MYLSSHTDTDPSSPLDRIRDLLSARQAGLVAGLVVLAVTVLLAGLLTARGTAFDYINSSTVDSFPPATMPSSPDGSGGEDAEPQTAGSGSESEPGSGSDSEPGSGGESEPGSGGESEPGSGGESDPGSGGESDPGSEPTDPDTPGTPANEAPVIADVDVETRGLTVVVRYLVDDPDSADVTTDVIFGGPVDITIGQAPQQSPITEGDGSGNGRGTDVFPLPMPAEGHEVLGPDPASADFGDHGPRPTADGGFEARYTYDRNQVGTAYQAKVTIVAVDSAGAEGRETITVDLEALNVVTLSDVNYRIPNSTCFDSTAARRLYGNIDLLGAIDVRIALDEELRLDRPEVTVLSGSSVEAPVGESLTVSFQPAMEGQELTSHVVTHTESNAMTVAIGSGDCAGQLTYRVTVNPRQ